jgi:DNA-binding SARP family transcriptional activator/LysM repeat protein
LAGFVVALATGSALLFRIAGGPHLPTALPDGTAIWDTLSGTQIPYAAIAYLCTSAAWAIWLWLAATLALQVLLVIADVATRGARWVRSLRGIVDRFTLPAVRRLAHGAAVAVTVVQLASRTVPSVSAAPAPVVATLVATVPTTSSGTSVSPAHPDRAGTLTYTVRHNDNLWRIAEQFYGNGDQWPEIVAANVGRPMPNGEVFPRNPVLQEGWVLLIPNASGSPAAAEQTVTYIVQGGDTLRSIAQRYYHDELAWPRIFGASRGTHLPDGRMLENPDLIWPGLKLTVPDVAVPPTTVHVAAPAPTSPPVAPIRPSHRIVTLQPTVTPAPLPTPIPPAQPPVLRREQSPQIAATQPAPVVTAAAPASNGLATPALQPHPAPPPSHLPPPVGEIGAAGLAAAISGGAVLLARRRYRTSIDEPPVPSDRDAGALVRQGYADAAYARTFAHRLDGGVEPALLVTEQVLASFAKDPDLCHVAVVSVLEGRHTMQLVLQAGLIAQERLLTDARDLARRLGSDGVAVRTLDHDIVLQLTNLVTLRLATRPCSGAFPALPLLALGVAPSGEALHINWSQIEHILVAGVPGSGADVVLTSVLTAVLARCHPDKLQMWTIAPPTSFPQPLLTVPHQAGPSVDPTDESGVQAVLAEVRAELERRMLAMDGHTQEQDEPNIVLVLHELTDVSDQELLELIGREGGMYGIHLIAATTRQEVISDALLETMATRLVLRMPDEAQSVRLLGRPDAVHLGGGGDLWARIEGRTPVRVRGYRVELEHLERLVDLMHAAYASQSPDPPSDDDDPGPAGDGSSPPPSDETDRVVQNDAEPVDDNNAVVDGEPANGSIGAGEVASPVPLADAEPEAQHPHTNGVVKSAYLESDLHLNADGETPLLPTTGAPTGVIESEATQPATNSSVATVETVAPAVTDLPGAPSATTRVRLRLFGTLHVVGEDATVTPRWQEQPWEILTYLAVHTANGVPKADLLATFWPDLDNEQGGTNLRQGIWRLRTSLTDQVPGLSKEVVGLEHGYCRLDSGLVWSDAQQFLALCEAVRQGVHLEQRMAMLEAARALCRRGLFTEPAYEWLDRRQGGTSIRQDFHKQFAWVIVQLADCYVEAGETERAVPLYRQVLRAEPTLQDVARKLYHCYAALGDQPALMEEHQRLEEALARRRSQAERERKPADSYRIEAKTEVTYRNATTVLQDGASAASGARG